jgi:hypothetical protein
MGTLASESGYTARQTRPADERAIRPCQTSQPKRCSTNATFSGLRVSD